MAFITKADLVTHVYPELIDVITRQNDDIVNKAINAGIGEARSFLNRFDNVAMLGTDSQAPSFQDEYFTMLVKDLIVWRLIVLANPNINVEVARLAYKDAKQSLEKIMEGDVDPGWPLRTDMIPTTTDQPLYSNGGGESVNSGLDPSGNIGWNSNRRRQSHW